MLLHTHTHTHTHTLMVKCITSTFYSGVTTYSDESLFYYQIKKNRIMNNYHKVINYRTISNRVNKPKYRQQYTKQAEVPSVTY